MNNLIYAYYPFLVQPTFLQSPNILQSPILLQSKRKKLLTFVPPVCQLHQLWRDMQEIKSS